MLKDFTKETFDILIQAGQSNSEGYGFGNVCNPYEVNDRVWYFNSDGTFQMAQEKVANNAIQSNFALAFARKYIQGERATCLNFLTLENLALLNKTLI